MVDISKVKIGDKLIWKGSDCRTSYGNRTVPAQVLEIKLPDRIKIKIFTPKGEMIKTVSPNSMDYA